MKLAKVFCLLFFSLNIIFSATCLEYVIASGDTLNEIIQKTGCEQALFVKCNPGYDFNKLKKGDVLLYPQVYVVKKGDTFYSLCKGWGVTLAELQSWNQLTSKDILKVGMSLYIPFPLNAKKTGDFFWPMKATPVKEDNILKTVSFDGQGREYYSVCEGTVVFKGEFRGLGPLVLVENNQKNIFAFGNFQTCIVEFGENVKKGQLLGVSGAKPGQRLSFFVFHQGETLDPFEARR